MVQSPPRCKAASLGAVQVPHVRAKGRSTACCRFPLRQDHGCLLSPHGGALKGARACRKSGVGRGTRAAYKIIEVADTNEGPALPDEQQSVRDHQFRAFYHARWGHTPSCFRPVDIRC
jgi:hypothetical protein